MRDLYTADEIFAGHIAWLRGDHDNCNLAIADTLEALRAERDALAAELAAVREALEPFARVAEHDIGESEQDGDTFRPMSYPYARALILTVGDLRRARAALKGDTP